MSEKQFVSRAGLKLEHALNEFEFDVTGLVCADFGCNIGGFTDCLLQRGAKLVYAIDTGYGTLDWKLRSDDRVITMERTNALHAEPPEKGESFDGVDLVTIDLAWTQQRHAIPAALKWLISTPQARIISLIKPHYEVTSDEKKTILSGGALEEGDSEVIFQRVLKAMKGLGVEVIDHTKSPITGRKSSKARKRAGNVEYLTFLKPIAVD